MSIELALLIAKVKLNHLPGQYTYCISQSTSNGSNPSITLVDSIFSCDRARCQDDVATKASDSFTVYIRTFQSLSLFRIAA